MTRKEKLKKYKPANVGKGVGGCIACPGAYEFITGPEVGSEECVFFKNKDMPVEKACKMCWEVE